MKKSIVPALFLLLSARILIAQSIPSSETLTVCGVQAYLGMTTAKFVEGMQKASECKTPSLAQLGSADHLALISVSSKNELKVRGNVRFQGQKVIQVTKHYSDPDTQLELGEWIIDLLSKFESEHRESCILHTETVAQPEQHTRTTNIVCGFRSLSITAGSMSVVDAQNRFVKGSFVGIDETLG